jgi:hypothetical protein
MEDKMLKSMEKAMTEDKEKKKNSFYFTTGNTLLDLVVGGGENIGYGMGYQAGTIVRDWGNTASSKTFKLCELISANYHKYKDRFKWVYDDTEFGNKFDSQKLYGFDIIDDDPEKQTHSLTVEDWANNIYAFLDSLKGDDIGIYGTDSLDGLSSADMEERKDERYKAFKKGKEFKEGTYGMQQAKFLSQEFFRGLASDLTKKNALLYVISQERDNVGGTLYQPKNKLGGGRAITFYETCRILSKKRQLIEQDDLATGVVIETIAEKTRHPRPFRRCMMPIYFELGIDDIGSNVDFLFDLRTPTGELIIKKVKDLTYHSEVFTREGLISYIEKEHLRKEIRTLTIDKWEAREEAVRIHRADKYADA